MGKKRNQKKKKRLPLSKQGADGKGEETWGWGKMQTLEKTKTPQEQIVGQRTDMGRSCSNCSNFTEGLVFYNDLDCGLI